MQASPQAHQWGGGYKGGGWGTHGRCHWLGAIVGLITEGSVFSCIVCEL